MKVLCACDDEFVPHTTTMLCSLLEHNHIAEIHLLFSALDKTLLETLINFISRYGTEIIPHKIETSIFDSARVDKHVSIATYYRLLAPRTLPDTVTKVLYLDSDLIVRSSLEAIWNIDLENYAVAAVENPPLPRDVELGLPVGARYFNAGVLLMNLVYWREHDVVNKALSFIEENQEKLEYWDQDALNAVLCNCWLQLPSRWNDAQHGEFRDWRFGRKIREEIRDPAIVHFAGEGAKPWQWSFEHPFKSEYHKYRLKTPWRRYELDGTPKLATRLRRQLRTIARGIARRGLSEKAKGTLDYFRFGTKARDMKGSFNGQPARQALFHEIVTSAQPVGIVETGTHLGTTTDFMAQTGLPVFTIELDPWCYGFARARFWRRRNVILLNGDSRPALRQLLDGPLLDMAHRTLFFYLDAHWDEYLLLADEIEIVFSRCPLAIVMIDDFQVPWDNGYGYYDYDSQKALTTEYILSALSAHCLQAFYPSTPSAQEGGLRRGCVILAKERVHGSTLAWIQSLRLIEKGRAFRADLLGSTVAV